MRTSVPISRTDGSNLLSWVSLPLLILVTGVAFSQCARRTRGTSADSSIAPNTPATESIEQSAKPALINLSDGQLTIDANNSQLSQILQDFSRQSGMGIQGDISNFRDFGHYRPQNTDHRDVVAKAGEPQELFLTDRTATVSPPLPTTSAETTEQPLGPCAIAHLPPPEADDTRSKNSRKVATYARRV